MIARTSRYAVASLLFGLVLAGGAVAQAQSQAAPVLAFAETVRNFGNVPEGPSVSHVFGFVNQGRAPLVISGVSASCGCITTSWVKEPIAPGGRGTVTVTMATQGRVGAYSREVYIASNAALPAGQQRLTLTLRGTVTSGANAADRDTRR